MTDHAPLPFPSQPDDRLRLALRKLQGALEEQAMAVAEFRGQVGRLAAAVEGLRGGLNTYRGRLAECALDLAEAREQALRLGRTSDIWLRG